MAWPALISLSSYLISCRPPPAAVDLDVLNSKPFKDATEVDSIRRLEKKLDNVAGGAAARPEEDFDEVGKKVSAMFLAQVEIEEAAGAGGAGDDKESKQKKGFIQQMRAKGKEKGEKADQPEKLFKKSSKTVRTRTF